MLGVTQRGVFEQGVNRGQPPVAGTGLVAAFAFEMVEERPDQLRVQIADVQARRPFAGARCGEGEQQPIGVPVAGDRVRAGVALSHEPVGEERLQHRRERGHGRLRSRSSFVRYR
jgi:hypothetical protein